MAMSDSTVAILVMLNNWFHDFAVALLFASLLVLSIIYRRTRERNDVYWHQFAGVIAGSFNKLIFACWAMIIVGGIFRTLAYERFEWSDAAGKGQISVLVIKHIILVSLVVWGTMIQIRLRRLLKRDEG